MPLLGAVGELLLSGISRKLGGGVYVDLKGMSLFLGRDLIEEIANGAGEDLQAVHEEGREEGDLQVTRGVREGIDGGGGGHLQGGLLQSLSFGNIGVGYVAFAHKAEMHSVHGEDAAHGLAVTRPVAGVVVGETVGKAPDAEVWVAGEQRNRYGAKILLHDDIPSFRVID